MFCTEYQEELKWVYNIILEQERIITTATVQNDTLSIIYTFKNGILL